MPLKLAGMKDRYKIRLGLGSTTDPNYNEQRNPRFITQSGLEGLSQVAQLPYRIRTSLNNLSIPIFHISTTNSKVPPPDTNSFSLNSRPNKIIFIKIIHDTQDAYLKGNDL